MKIKMTKRIAIIVACAMFIFSSPLNALDTERDTICSCCSISEEIVASVQVLLEDFYTSNNNVTYRVYYNSDALRTANSNNYFYVCTVEYYQNEDWHAIIEYIIDNKVEIERTTIVKIEERSLSAIDTYRYETSYVTTVTCTECFLDSVFAVDLWAHVRYDTNTGWITGVNGCYLDIVTASPAHPYVLSYDDSTADWQMGSDETSLVFYGIIDVAYAQSSTPDDISQQPTAIMHYFRDTHTIHASFDF